MPFKSDNETIQIQQLGPTEILMIIDINCIGGLTNDDMKYYRNKWKKELDAIQSAYSFFVTTKSGYYENTLRKTYSGLTREVTSSIILRFTCLEIPDKIEEKVTMMKKYYGAMFQDD